MKEPIPHLKHILDTVDVIKNTKPANSQALIDDLNARDATLMRLQDIGEQLARIRDNFPQYYEENRDDDWPKIIGLRNIISHGYREIDFAIVWGVIDRQLEPFAKHISSLL